MAVQQALTLEQFLVWQSTQEMKHEYDRGRIIPHIVAMDSGTKPHNRIEANLVREPAVAFEDSGFETFTSNQLVATEDGSVGFFPDAALLEGSPVKVRYGTQNAATNAVAVFEICSRSTADHDSGTSWRSTSRCLRCER